MNNKYVIVRTKTAGVHAGYIESWDPGHLILLNSRRLWYWKGAATLNQLAMEGVKYPEECKFPCEVAKIHLLDANEIIETTEIAKLSIQGVPIWTA